MFLKIRQKYWTLKDKFALTDENGYNVFWASSQLLKLRSNLDLYNLDGMLLYHMEARFNHMFSYYVINNSAGQQIGYIDELIHWPGFRRAKMKLGDITLKIKGGPIHMKTMLKNEKGKWDKKNPAVYSAKKLFVISDVYKVEINERLIDPSIGAIVALWYDKVRYGHKH